MIQRPAPRFNVFALSAFAIASEYSKYARLQESENNFFEIEKMTDDCSVTSLRLSFTSHHGYFSFQGMKLKDKQNVKKRMKNLSYVTLYDDNNFVINHLNQENIANVARTWCMATMG